MRRENSYEKQGVRGEKIERKSDNHVFTRFFGTRPRRPRAALLSRAYRRGRMVIYLETRDDQHLMIDEELSSNHHLDMESY